MSLKPKKHRNRQNGPPELLAFRPAAAEPVLRDLKKVLDGKQFHNMQELDQFLSSLTPGRFDETVAAAGPASPQDQAQDLAYEAMDAPTPEQALALARRAVELDPDCVDALVIMADLSSSSDKEYVKSLEKAVQAGERSLGKDFFRENRGQFWVIVETRPYMRARAQLAQILKGQGRVRDSIAHFEALLDLNPNDNQGVRDDLVGAYLLESEPWRNGADDPYLVKARHLLKQFRDDDSAVFRWARALERVLSSDFRGAARLLKIARSHNRHVEQYVSLKKMQGPMPDSYSPGDDSEARHCMFAMGLAWFKHPQAFFYLQGALGDKAGHLPDLNELERA